MKYIKIGLIFIYVFFNTGLTYSFHFCENVFQEINFFSDHQTCCASESPMKGCCDDVTKFDFPNADQQASEKLTIQSGCLDFLTPQMQWMEITPFPLEDMTIVFSGNSPPDFLPVPIFILHQSFLI
jgi:hypothetical protein